MRECCTSGSVGAPVEQSLGRPDNLVLRAAQNFAKNFVRPCAHPTARLNATELHQEMIA
jgi:hypothetical protein